MLRTTALALVFSMLPASALACGMRMAPESDDKLLAEILEEIDAAPPVVVPAPVAPVQAQAPAEKTETPSVIAEVAVVQPKS